MKDLDKTIRSLHPADRKALKHELTDATRHLKARANISKIDPTTHKLMSSYRGSGCPYVELLFFFPSVLLVLQVRPGSSSSSSSSSKSSKLSLFRSSSPSAAASSSTLISSSPPTSLLQAAGNSSSTPSLSASVPTGSSSRVSPTKRRSPIGSPGTSPPKADGVAPPPLLSSLSLSSLNTTAASSSSSSSSSTASGSGSGSGTNATSGTNAGQSSGSGSNKPAKQKSKAVLYIDLSTPSIAIEPIDDLSFHLVVTRNDVRTTFLVSDFFGRDGSCPDAARCAEWKAWLLEAINFWNDRWNSPMASLASSSTGSKRPSLFSKKRRDSGAIDRKLTSIAPVERPPLTEDSVRFTKDRDGKRLVSMGNIVALFNIACGLYDNTKQAVEPAGCSRLVFLEGLLLIYRAYMSPENFVFKLLDNLQTYFSIPHIRTTIFKVIDLWLHRYRADFTPALVEKLYDGISQALGSGQIASEFRAKLEAAIQYNAEQQSQLATFKATRHKGLARLSASSLSENELQIARPTPLDLAMQILHIDLRLFSALEFCELLSHQASINLSALFDFRSRLSKAIANAILVAPGPKERMEELTFWITVGHHLAGLPVPIDSSSVGAALRTLTFCDANAIDALAKGLDILRVRPELLRVLDADTQAKWQALLAARVTPALASSSTSDPSALLEPKTRIPSIVDCLERCIEIQLRYPDSGELIDIARIANIFQVCSVLEMPSLTYLSTLQYNSSIMQWLNGLPVDSAGASEPDFWPELAASLHNIDTLNNNIEQLLSYPNPQINGQPASYKLIQGILDNVVSHDLKKFLKWTQWNYRNSRTSYPIYIYGGGCHIDFKTPIQYRRERITRRITNRSTVPLEFNFEISPLAYFPRTEFAFTVSPTSGVVEPSQDVTIEFSFETRNAAKRMGHFWLDIQPAGSNSPTQIERYLMLYEAHPLQFGSHLKEFGSDEVQTLLASARPLATGGEGAIYLGETPELGQVVIKQYITFTDTNNPEEWQFLEDSQEAFRREVTCFDDLASLSSANSNIVKAYGFCRYPPCVLMEYVGGGSVASLIERGETITSKQLYTIARGILRALSFLHDNGIIHRDLKPDNILISTGFKSAKLCDLGTSYRGVREIGIQKNAGTLVYSAPEVLRHDEYYTKDGAPPLYGNKIDIWSFGMCVRAIITRERSPYLDISKDLMIEKALLSGRTPDLVGIKSQFWHDLVLDCLHQDPEKRDTAQALRKRIKANRKAILADEDFVANRDSSPTIAVPRSGDESDPSLASPSPSASAGSISNSSPPPLPARADRPRRNVVTEDELPPKDAGGSRAHRRHGSHVTPSVSASSAEDEQQPPMLPPRSHHRRSSFSATGPMELDVDPEDEQQPPALLLPQSAATATTWAQPTIPPARDTAPPPLAPLPPLSPLPPLVEEQQHATTTSAQE